MISLNDRLLHEDKPRRYAVGLDLGGTNLKYGIVSDRGEVIYQNVIPVFADHGRDHVLQTMVDAAYECVMFGRKESFEVEGIGVGCPGTIDSDRGISLGPTPHLPDWENAPIAEYISQKMNLPVFADNDANFMAFGEAMLGAGKQYKLVVGITLGTGVGGGIIINGNIFHGSSYNGAELGHTIVEAHGRPCGCGNQGCLEQYAGGKYIVKEALSAIARGDKSVLSSVENITPKTIFDFAQKNDPLCLNIVEQMVFYLGAGLSSIVHVLNPDIIIIGGGLSEAGDAFVSRIHNEVIKRVMKPIKPKLQIVRAKLGNTAGLLGAGYYVLYKNRSK
ncbi:MAG TPA: ROK family protein [bacterium]|nr:ROK family protein [bacterium]